MKDIRMRSSAGDKILPTYFTTGLEFMMHCVAGWRWALHKCTCWK